MLSQNKSKRSNSATSQPFSSADKYLVKEDPQLRRPN